MSKKKKAGSRKGAIGSYVPSIYSVPLIKHKFKTSISAVVVVFFLVACGSKPDQIALVQEGKVLMEASDCKTCHHATNKIIGPPHAEVAKKYEFTDANVSMLAQRIIAGGSGVWGEIPMNAHPDMTKEDAEKIARYVLSLDGEQPK